MSTKSILVQGGDGTAIPAGMVGEQITASGAAYTGSSTTNTTLSSISLGAGVWEVTGYVSVQNDSGTLSLAEVSAALTTNASLSVAIYDCVNNPTTMCGGYVIGVSNVLRYTNSVTNRFQNASTTTIYLRLGLASTGGGNVAVLGRLRAVRIA